jgi:hypothetical protein
MLDFSPRETRVNPTTGQRYYICHNCDQINSVEDHERKREKLVWQIFTTKHVKKAFKILAATLDMTYEDTLLYLMRLHEKEQSQVYNSISVAVGSNITDDSTRRKK